MFRRSINDVLRTLHDDGERPSALGRLHRGEDGLLTYSAAVAMMFFLVSAALVMNVNQSIRQKVHVQNAADAAAQTAAASLARGMNGVTAVNHLLGELTALCVLHEALGGPELDKGQKESSSISQQLNISLEAALKVAQATIGPYAYLGQLDQPAVDLLTDDDGEHSSWATIFDSRMTLKYHLLIALTLRPVATALLVIPYAGPTLALGLHIAIAAVVARIYSETHILNGIDVVAQGFSPAKLAVEASILPLAAAYAQHAVDEAPRAAAALVEEVGDRNGVEVFLFPEKPTLPLERRTLQAAVGGGEEPPAGDASAGALAAPFEALQDMHKTITDVVDFFKDAVSSIPILGDIADEIADITIPPMSIGGLGPGPDGYDQNISRKNMPKLSAAGWDEVRFTQWTRASYPYLNAWRLPVRESLAGLESMSFAAKWYSRWTNRYQLVKVLKYHRGEYGGLVGQKQLAMFVMSDERDDAKGREPWTTDNAAAEQKFTVVAFAHRGAKTPVGAAIFGAGAPDGITTYAQAVFYNGNDQRPGGWSKNSEHQPTVGWDTLNWQSPAPAARALEFIHGDEMDGLSLLPPPFAFVLLSDPPGDPPRVNLNWQAKLTPVTRLGESWSQTSGAMRVPLQKMHEEHGSFRTH